MSLRGYWLGRALRATHQWALAMRRTRRHTAAYVGAALASGLLHGLLLAAAVLIGVSAWVIAWPLGVVAALALLLTSLGGPLAHRVLAPLGLVRASYLLQRCSLLGGSAVDAVLAGTRAHLRRPGAAGAAWLHGKLTSRGMVGDVEVTVHALTSAASDRDGAAALLATLPAMVERHPAARELAAEYLAAYDAARGAWARIGERAAAGALWPATPTTLLLEGVAARLTPGAPAPSSLELRVRWLLAPHRRRTRALLRLAPAAVPAPAHEPAAAPVTTPPATEPIAAALALHVHAVRRPARAAVAAAGAAWDACLADPDVIARLSSRAAAHAVDAEAIRRALRAEVAAELGALASAAGVIGELAGSGGGLGSAATAQARATLLAETELALDAYRARAVSKLPLPAIDEWRAFVAIRAQYEDAARRGGLEVRRLLFPHLSAALAPMSSWLWNQRREYVISAAITRLLLDEATAVGDARAIEHEGRNAALTVPVRSR